MVVLADGAAVAAFTLGDDDDWTERAFDLPAASSPTTSIELRALGGPLAIYHYWFVAR